MKSSEIKTNKERLINIELEDGTILDKNKIEQENFNKEEKRHSMNAERVIPITLDSGDIKKPNFTFMEELKLPTWSVFHNNGKEKENEIPIIRGIGSAKKSLSKTNEAFKRNSVTGLETLV